MDSNFKPTADESQETLDDSEVDLNVKTPYSVVFDDNLSTSASDGRFYTY